MLHETEEEVIEPGEQPELLEQRHHHGLFQQARRGAAQADTHPGKRGLVDISSSSVANISFLLTSLLHHVNIFVYSTSENLLIYTVKNISICMMFNS